jgi:hypothetical protein
MSVVYTMLLISAERREASHPAGVHQYIGKPQNSCKESVRKRYSLEKISEKLLSEKNPLLYGEGPVPSQENITQTSSARFCRLFFLHHTAPFRSL